MDMRMMFAIVALTVFPAAGNASVMFDGNGALAIEGDKYCMNWILKADGSQYRFVGKESAWGRVNGADGFEISRSRRADGGDIVESVTLRNPRSEAAALEGVSVNFPFNDNYPESHECVKRRCNAHLWPHGSAAWACAMRMGGEAPHLGWMLTKGEVDGYTISNRGRKNGSSNFRGVIAFRLPKVELAPGGEYTLEWRLFAHDGWDDFKAKLDERGGLWVEADRYVGAVGDEIAVTCENSKGKSVRKVRLDAPGEKIVDVEVEGKKTRVELLAISDFKKFIGRRLDFVLAHQQYGKADDPRDGAFLPYDNETGELRKAWLGPFIAKGIPEPDMNEGRERLGMGIAIAEAIRGMGYDNPAALAALRKYASFVRSRLQDKNYKTWGDYAPRKRHRIYNYAWVARFYFNMYDITGEGAISRGRLPDCARDIPLRRTQILSYRHACPPVDRGAAQGRARGGRQGASRRLSQGCGKLYRERPLRSEKRSELRTVHHCACGGFPCRDVPRHEREEISRRRNGVLAGGRGVQRQTAELASERRQHPPLGWLLVREAQDVGRHDAALLELHNSRLLRQSGGSDGRRELPQKGCEHLRGESRALHGRRPRRLRIRLSGCGQRDPGPLSRAAFQRRKLRHRLRRPLAAIKSLGRLGF